MRRAEAEAEPVATKPKRLFPRLPLALSVAFARGDLTARGTTVNVSLRGMLVSTSQPPAVGEVVRLVVTLHAGRQAIVDGRVTYSALPDEAGGETGSFAMELVRPNEEYAAFLGLLVAASVRAKGTP